MTEMPILDSTKEAGHCHLKIELGFSIEEDARTT